MPSRSLRKMSGSAEDEAVKITSACATHAISSGARRMSNVTSGNSAARTSADARLRFTSVTWLQPFDSRCFTRSLDIFPAPTMRT